MMRFAYGWFISRWWRVRRWATFRLAERFGICYRAVDPETGFEMDIYFWRGAFYVSAVRP